MLHQGFPHCAISPTAASRRSLGRVSVPMWPFNLSVRLPIVALVGRYPANWLIGREPIFQRIAPLILSPCGNRMLCGISVRFQTLFPSERQVAHVLLTRPPLRLKSTPKTISLDLVSVTFRKPSSKNIPYFLNTLHLQALWLSVLTSISVRLACVRHAASVRPEPGSNSLKYCIKTSFDALIYFRAFA